MCSHLWGLLGAALSYICCRWAGKFAFFKCTTCSSWLSTDRREPVVWDFTRLGPRVVNVATLATALQFLVFSLHSAVISVQSEIRARVRTSICIITANRITWEKLILQLLFSVYYCPCLEAFSEIDSHKDLMVVLNIGWDWVGATLLCIYAKIVAQLSMHNDICWIGADFTEYTIESELCFTIMRCCVFL